jgi:prolipoprotein diacylglyceryltransferase
MRKELGKILIDIAKLVIGGVILAGLMRQDIEPVLLFTIGGIVSVLMILIGLFLVSWNKRSDNNNN